MSDPLTFGTLLRRHRRTMGVTQETLAERAGVSVRAISDLERGARIYPYRDTASRLADALGLSGRDRASLLALGQRPAATATLGRLATDLCPTGASWTRLIGREAECLAVIDLLQDDRTRLLTLTGPAGVGKTRLALHVANELCAAFRDGVAVIDLAPVADSSLVLHAIAAALNVSDQGNISQLEAVHRRLHKRQLLLVLDSFEHLLPAAPVLSDILQMSSGVQALVTSQAPLRLRWERELAIMPLPTPKHDDGVTPASVNISPAVSLFIDRAQAVDATFRLTTENTGAVMEICRRLDGLPLAIELAAVRTRVLSPRALLDRLGDRFVLLTSGPRDAPVRQRTLWDAIAWSYDLLPPDQQALLRHLAFFVGGWSLEAAEFVGAVQGVPETLDALDALVAYNLIVREDASTGPRYRMLESIREFAAKQLVLANESMSARHTFLEYLIHCARVNDLETLDADAGRRLDHLRAENANLHSGLEWALEHAPAHAMELLAELDWYWFHADQPVTGRMFCERALAAGADRHEPMRLRVAAQVAWLSSAVGNFADLDPHVDAVRAMATSLGDARSLAYVRMYDGDLVSSQGDGTQATVILREALAQFEGVHDVWGLMVCLNALGIVAQDLGDPGEAVMCFERIEAIMSERRLPPHFRAHTLVNLASAYRLLGRAQDAFAAAEHALRLASEARRVSVTAAAQEEMARYHLGCGDLDQAVPLTQASLATRWEIGSSCDLAPALELAGMMFVRRGSPGLAAQLFASAYALREAMPYPIGVGEQLAVHAALADARSALGEEEFSRAWTTGKKNPVDSSVHDAIIGLKRRANA